MTPLFRKVLLVNSAWVTFGLCAGLHAQTTAQDWQTKAIERFPDLGVQGSDLNKRFVEAVTERRKTNPAFFTEPQWPLILAGDLTKPGGFLNVPWGTPRDKAKEIISQREGVVFDATGSDTDEIYFNGGSFSDFQVVMIALAFSDGQFYRGMVIVRPRVTLRDTWLDLVTGLNKKYGQGYGMGDKQHTYWHFPNEDNPTESVDCMVAADGKGVGIVYTNVPMEEKEKKAHKEGIKTKDL